MNENQLRRVKKEIYEMLDKKEIRIEKYLDDYNKITESVGFIKAANGNPMLVYLYSTIKEDNQIVTLEVDVDYMFNEANIRPIFTDDQIIDMMEFVNLINRQVIVGHLFVHWSDKAVYLRKDINLVNGRLSKAELELSINELFNNASFYYPLIMERINSNEPLSEMSKRHWVDSSYLHKECRSDWQGKP
jgi:hypothetical protein